MIFRGRFRQRGLELGTGPMGSPAGAISAQGRGHSAKKAFGCPAIAIGNNPSPVSGFNGSNGRNQGRTIGVAFLAGLRIGVVASRNYSSEIFRTANFGHRIASALPLEVCGRDSLRM